MATQKRPRFTFRTPSHSESVSLEIRFEKHRNRSGREYNAAPPREGESIAAQQAEIRKSSRRFRRLRTGWENAVPHSSAFVGITCQYGIRNPRDVEGVPGTSSCTRHTAAARKWTKYAIPLRSRCLSPCQYSNSIGICTRSRHWHRSGQNRGCWYWQIQLVYVIPVLASSGPSSLRLSNLSGPRASGQAQESENTPNGEPSFRSLKPPW